MPWSLRLVSHLTNPLVPQSFNQELINHLLKYLPIEIIEEIAAVMERLEPRKEEYLIECIKDMLEFEDSSVAPGFFKTLKTLIVNKNIATAPNVLQWVCQMIKWYHSQDNFEERYAMEALKKTLDFGANANCILTSHWDGDASAVYCFLTEDSPFLKECGRLLLKYGADPAFGFSESNKFYIWDAMLDEDEETTNLMLNNLFLSYGSK